MAFANSNFDAIVTTTLKNRTGKVADNVTANNSVLAELSRKGNIMLEDGGQSLVQELDFAENSTFKYYSGWEVLDVNQSDVISAAEFDWKQAAVSVVCSGACSASTTSGSATAVCVGAGCSAASLSTFALNPAYFLSSSTGTNCGCSVRQLGPSFSVA